MNRRTFTRRSTLAAAATLLPGARLSGASIALEKMARIGCGTFTFRNRFPAMSLFEVPDFFAKELGVKILVENHGGHGSLAENVVAIVEAVDSPWCRSLPDFGNCPGIQEERHAFLKNHPALRGSFKRRSPGRHPPPSVGRIDKLRAQYQSK